MFASSCLAYCATSIACPTDAAWGRPNRASTTCWKHARAPARARTPNDRQWCHEPNDKGRMPNSLGFTDLQCPCNTPPSVPSSVEAVYEQVRGRHDTQWPATPLCCTHGAAGQSSITWSANAMDVPGPRLVMMFPSVTTSESTSVGILAAGSRQ